METETYERRHDKDLQNLYEKPNILSYCRTKRIEWAGHVRRAEGKRPIGRPRTRCRGKRYKSDS